MKTCSMPYVFGKHPEAFDEKIGLYKDVEDSRIYIKEAYLDGKGNIPLVEGVHKLCWNAKGKTWVEKM